MIGEESGGPFKKPRIDNCIDLAQIDDLKEQVRKLEDKNQQLKSLEEQNEQLKASLKEVQDEKKEVGEAMEELRGMVECPVCLLVPRDGVPVPVCSNGHFVCCTCRDRIRKDAHPRIRIRQEALAEPKCPSCMVNLGNSTSLLASRLIEKLKHECEQDGCGEMIPFPDLEKHKLVCLFRKVLCPGNLCRLEIQFNKFKEHTLSCDNLGKKTWSNICSWSRFPTRNKYSPTKTLSANGKLFFMKTKRENQVHMFETIMFGSEEECKGYLSSITILYKDCKTFATFTSHPRPISMEKWGDMGLMASEKALARIWTDKDEKFEYQVELSITKV